MSTAIAEPRIAATHICPQCGAIARHEPGEGRVVVAVYCLHANQRAGQPGVGLTGAHPARMEVVSADLEHLETSSGR